MPDFRFELEALLKYRRHQLDQCRQLMSEVLSDQMANEQQKSELNLEREQIAEEVRHKIDSGKINISSQASSRYYMAQLDGQLRQVSAQIDRTNHQLELCRRAVIQADMAVKALEQLREKRKTRHLQKELKQEEQQLQELWLGQKIAQQAEVHFS